jgi:DNA-binding transcriptional LysR family regulator
MSKRLMPSTTALQCFEAAARHLSFTRAAQELHLTQSAVSKQVAQLEDMLAHPLFQRIRRRLHLTPAGALYLTEVNKILTQIDISSRYILSYGDETEVLRIATQPTFGARWLVPRLKGFGERTRASTWTSATSWSRSTWCRPRPTWRFSLARAPGRGDLHRAVQRRGGAGVRPSCWPGSVSTAPRR